MIIVNTIAEIFANLSKNSSTIGMLKTLQIGFKMTFKMGLIIKFPSNSKTMKMMISKKNSNMIIHFRKKLCVLSVYVLIFNPIHFCSSDKLFP